MRFFGKRLPLLILFVLLVLLGGTKEAAGYDVRASMRWGGGCPES